MQTRSTFDRPVHTMPRESFGELLSQLANHSAALVRDELDLAKQEMRENVRSLRTGVVTLVIGALIGSIALGTLTAAAVIGLAHLMDAGYAALIVGAVLIIVGAGVAFAGINRIKRTSLKPEQTIETLEEDREWLKELT